MLPPPSTQGRSLSFRAWLLLALLFALGSVSSTHAESAARIAANRLGSALRSADAAALRGMLPAKGKVELRLDRFGPGSGYFSPQQTEALFRTLFERASIQSFEIIRATPESGDVMLFLAGVKGRDREGHPVTAGLHLAFHSEQGRWVLRELREIPK